MASHFILSLTFLAFITARVKADTYCANPGFIGAPQVTQVDTHRVLVNWDGLVSEEECFDYYRVQYWKESSPLDKEITDYLTPSTRQATIRVLPNVSYQFKAAGIEVRAGVTPEWVYSSATTFKTSSGQDGASGGSQVVTKHFDGKSYQCVESE